MEDAISLARILNEETDEAALSTCRGPCRLMKTSGGPKPAPQNAARNSMEWFENARRYVRLDPEQFAYSLLTRSQRVSHENLRLRDRTYLEGVERWLAGRTGKAVEKPIPPLFTPFTLRGMTVENRVVISPMDMYSAEDGLPNDFHLVHLSPGRSAGPG